jgi:uncharacterized protein YodC (DUF2158 family)
MNFLGETIMFNIGNKVILKSDVQGTPAMTVIGIGQDGTVRCQWPSADGASIHDETYHPAQLRLHQ